MLFVTLHGGKPGIDSKTNNVYAYKEGKRLTSSVLDNKPGIVLDELRGIGLHGKYLYVVNANKFTNRVLCYQGSLVNYAFVDTFASHETCAGILHPFDITFDDAGHAYVSSQDTNVVTRLKLSGDGRTATPAAIAPALPAQGKFLPGTFVASNVSLEPPTTPVPRPQGLEYSADGPKKHSVRGVAWANGALYVADQPSTCIKVYDKDGKFLGQSNPAGTPVHLLAANGSLYVSGDDHVRVAKLPNPPGDFTLSVIKSIDVKNGCGMAFGSSGNFYVASRTENVILKFDPQFQPMDFKIHLLDNPEFLLHV
jgi:hypothetical protein